MGCLLMSCVLAVGGGGGGGGGVVVVEVMGLIGGCGWVFSSVASRCCDCWLLKRERERNSKKKKRIKKNI